MSTELERFIEIWEREAAKTEKLLESLPRDAYDFRPDPEGRSLGELAWHLVEAEGYGALGIERGEFARDVKPDGITRPRTIEELAPGFSRVHTDAVSPNSLSFISAIASSSSSTAMMPTTGPKLSSRITDMEWSTSTSTCGAR